MYLVLCEAFWVEILWRARSFVRPPGASLLLLEVGALPGSQHRPAQLLLCHLLVGLGCLLM